MTAEKLAKEIMKDIDDFVFPGNERECQEVIKEHLEEIFRMAETTIRDTLSKVRVSDD